MATGEKSKGAPSFHDTTSWGSVHRSWAANRTWNRCGARGIIPIEDSAPDQTLKNAYRYLHVRAKNQKRRVSGHQNEGGFVGEDSLIWVSISIRRVFSYGVIVSRLTVPGPVQNQPWGSRMFFFFLPETQGGSGLGGMLQPLPFPGPGLLEASLTAFSILIPLPVGSRYTGQGGRIGDSNTVSA